MLIIILQVTIESEPSISPVNSIVTYQRITQVTLMYLHANTLTFLDSFVSFDNQISTCSLMSEHFINNILMQL